MRPTIISEGTARRQQQSLLPLALPVLRARRAVADTRLAAASDSEPSGPEEEQDDFVWPSREQFFECESDRDLWKVLRGALSMGFITAPTPLQCLNFCSTPFNLTHTDVYERLYESGIGFAPGAANPERKRRRRPFHLHIGAGRLGLGLVVPAVCRSGTPIGILQRPSGAWKPLMESGRLDVVINKEVGYQSRGALRNLATHLRVSACSFAASDSNFLTPALQPVSQKGMVVVRDLTELPVDFDESQPDLFVLSEDPILLSNLVGYATSFSMSLG